MTEDLAPTLRRLAGHLNHLQDHIYDTPLHATRYSQTDSHQSHGGPKSPTNDTDLDYLNDVQGRLGELCRNVSDDLRLVIPTNVITGNFWAAWLYRNRGRLQELDWYEDLAESIVDLELELRAKIHPTDMHEIRLPDYATAEEISKATGKKPNTIRTWCRRNNVTAYIENGTTKYRTAEVKY